MIPDPGQLCATLLIELTSEEQVHDLHFEFTVGEIESFATGDVRIAVDHRSYNDEIDLVPARSPNRSTICATGAPEKG